MARHWKEVSLKVRSVVIALGVSAGLLLGQYAGRCLSGRGACTLDSPVLWGVWAVTFFAIWGASFAAMWALERHRRNHPGHETR